jgi:kelch-like protein 12
VFLAVEQWRKHQSGLVGHQLRELIALLRYPLMSAEFLYKHVESNDTIMTNGGVPLVLEAYRHKLIPGAIERAQSSGDAACLRRCRMRRPLRDCILLIGGVDGVRTCSTIHCLSVSPQAESFTIQLSEICSQNIARSECAAAFLDGHLYVIGGRQEGGTTLRSVERFDFETMSWTDVAPLNVERQRAGAAVLNGRIYVVGGESADSMDHASAEVYDPSANSWTFISEMQSPRTGCAVVQCGAFIYAIGGWDGANLVNTMERYDPRTNVWVQAESMLWARDTSSSVELDGQIYVIGGWDGDRDTSDVERYDPVTNEWMLMPSMGTPRSLMGCAVLHGQIFACGGKVTTFHDPRSTYTASCERFDPQRKRWSPVCDGV